MSQTDYKATATQDSAQFVGKVTAVKTRRGRDKDYFAFRLYIPKHVVDHMKLVNGDYLFFRAEKAKWYHMVEWDQMPQTWQMLPAGVKSEINLSGVSTSFEYSHRASYLVPSPTGAVQLDPIRVGATVGASGGVATAGLSSGNRL